MLGVRTGRAVCRSQARDPFSSPKSALSSPPPPLLLHPSPHPSRSLSLHLTASLSLSFRLSTTLLKNGPDGLNEINPPCPQPCKSPCDDAATKPAELRVTVRRCEVRNQKPKTDRPGPAQKHLLLVISAAAKPNLGQRGTLSVCHRASTHTWVGHGAGRSDRWEPIRESQRWRTN